ncbi:MAG: nucleoside monophosphate kinase [archaeon]|nr:nucleoside monophosphate kinase [archaeon]
MARKITKKANSEKKIAVVISGMPSVGKTTAAEVISKRFRLAHIAGGDMLREMAIERGYDPEGPDWWDSREGMKFLAERSSDPKFDKEVDRKLIEYIRRGGVVITSYTIPWLCNDGLKIWFSASPRARAKRLAGRDRISFAPALKIINQRDARNRLLYSKLYKIEFGKDLSVFNYIIDTEDMTAREVVEAAARLVSDYKNSLSI